MASGPSVICFLSCHPALVPLGPGAACCSRLPPFLPGTDSVSPGMPFRCALPIRRAPAALFLVAPRRDCRRPLRAVRLCPCPDPCGAQGRAVRDDSKTDSRLRRSTPGGPAGQSSIPGDSGVGSVGHTHWHLSANVASPGRGRTALASPNARCARDLGKGRSSAHPPLPAPPRARVTPLVRESTADSSRPLLLAPNLGQRPWRRLWHHPVSSVVSFVGRFCPMEDGI